MSRINIVNHETATGKAKDLLDGVKKKVGFAPNLMTTMANSPVVLEGYLGLSGALAGGGLDAKLREQIAITVAEANSCQYCLSAHTAIGKMTGVIEAELESARAATSANGKIQAALRFASDVNEKRGQVSDADLAAIRNAGYSDGEITEIVAHVALNVLTNYTNNVAQTEVDFPKVELRAKATA